MPKLSLLLLPLLLAFGAAWADPKPEAPVEDSHVVSQSRMFSVSGGDGLRMGAIASRADEIFYQVCDFLGVDRKWKFAVSIRLLGQPGDAPVANPVRTRIAIISGEPNFQIRIYPGGGLDVNRLTNAIITMVLYERALRNVPANSFPERLSMPDWLVTGVLQALLWKRGRADRRLYQNLFNRAEMLSPEEIISTEAPWKLDAGTRQLYELSCGVLVQCLISQPGGQASLRELVAEAATMEGTPREIISSHFHTLGVDENALAKWWALQLAEISALKATEALTPLETEKRLAEALVVMVYDPGAEAPRPVNMDDVYSLTEVENWRELVRPNLEQLVDLSMGCFPGYRLIIADYCRVISELTRGATPDEVQNILGPLSELRRAYMTASIRGRDYLDWYEITHLGEGSGGSFDAYLDAMQVLRREQPGPDTPISRYLDDIEALHSLEPGAALPERLQPQDAKHGSKE